MQTENCEKRTSYEKNTKSIQKGQEDVFHGHKKRVPNSNLKNSDVFYDLSSELFDFTRMKNDQPVLNFIW